MQIFVIYSSKWIVCGSVLTQNEHSTSSQQHQKPSGQSETFIQYKSHHQSLIMNDTCRNTSQHSITTYNQLDSTVDQSSQTKDQSATTQSQFSNHNTIHHPDKHISGHYLNSHILAFDRIKLTNRSKCHDQQVCFIYSINLPSRRDIVPSHIFSFKL